MAPRVLRRRSLTFINPEDSIAKERRSLRNVHVTAEFFRKSKLENCTMLRRSFLLGLGGVGLSAYAAQAKTIPLRDFRTADLMGGSFAMQSSQLALTRTRSADVTSFANAEIAEQT